MNEGSAASEVAGAVAGAAVSVVVEEEQPVARRPAVATAVSAVRNRRAEEGVCEEVMAPH